MLYLGIPNVLFGLYLSPITLVISVIALIYVLWIVCKQIDLEKKEFSTISIQILLLLVCIIWVFLSGVTGQIYSNPDWPVRLTVLNDLITNHWPVIYEHENQRYFLRAPLGYYLPSAFIGKIFNSYTVGLWSLFAWGVIGTYLTLSIVIKSYTFRKAAIGVAIIVCFSGLDIIGFLARHHGELHLGDHLEWWAGRWQYSSNTTLLFWVPNHAISAWLFTALMMRKNDDSIFWNASPILLGMTLAFSPLSFIGSAVLYCIYFYKKIIFSLCHVRIYQASAVISLILFGLGAGYILSGTSTIHQQSNSTQYSWALIIVGYLIFIFLEFGILAPLIKPWVRQKYWLYLSCGALASIPLLPAFGPGNDLVMRASIAPLFCLCLVALDGILLHLEIKRGVRKTLVIMVLILGSITAIFELQRPFIVSNSKFNPVINLYEFTQGRANHYYAPCNNQPIIACDKSISDN